MLVEEWGKESVYISEMSNDDLKAIQTEVYFSKKISSRLFNLLHPPGLQFPLNFIEYDQLTKKSFYSFWGCR